jgi:microcystin-dependent protein
MSGSTTNFNWILPIVGGDANIWGGATTGLNFNLIAQDALVRRMVNTFINATEPAEKQSGTQWIDNTANPWIWKIYNSTGTPGWITIGTLDPTTNTFTPASGSVDGFQVGDLKYCVLQTNHPKWLGCNGLAISRVTYSALFNVFNALVPALPFGVGDGVTTFNLPDLRGAVAGALGLSGLVASGGNTPWSAPTTRSIGTYQGEERHTLIKSELPDPVTTTAGQGGTAAGGNVVVFSSTGYGIGTVSNQGGNQTHNTMQPTVFAGNYFIFTGV